LRRCDRCGPFVRNGTTSFSVETWCRRCSSCATTSLGMAKAAARSSASASRLVARDKIGTSHPLGGDAALVRYSFASTMGSAISSSNVRCWRAHCSEQRARACATHRPPRRRVRSHGGELGQSSVENDSHQRVAGRSPLARPRCARIDPLRGPRVMGSREGPPPNTESGWDTFTGLFPAASLDSSHGSSASSDAWTSAHEAMCLNPRTRCLVSGVTQSARARASVCL
jgi:hypothetical protein